MRILLINTSDRTGGAAVAANRLLKALQKKGVIVNMLVRDKVTQDTSVVSINTSVVKKLINRIRFVWERLVIFLCNHLSKENLFQVSIANTGTDILHSALVKEADVIHIHWINQGMLSLSDIKRLIDSGKPVVWTLHDMWPATGVCHYAGLCDQYRLECTQCPMMKHPFFWNLARTVYRHKSTIGLEKITFVGCSRWITEMCEQSRLLRNASFYSIPNPIDTALFKPHNKQNVRGKYNLPIQKKLVLFAAAKVSDSRKGLTYLIEACHLLAERHANIEILLMGSKADEIQCQLPVPSHQLGYVSSLEQIAEIYSLSDVFVISSLEDNLPNTIMEAMACGTPCVGFQTGGIPEMIDHLENGYVARYQDAEDLAQGITWVLDHPHPQQLAEACVEKVKTHYSEEVIAGKYIALYQKLMDKEKI